MFLLANAYKMQLKFKLSQVSSSVWDISQIFCAHIYSFSWLNSLQFTGHWRNSLSHFYAYMMSCCSWYCWIDLCWILTTRIKSTRPEIKSETIAIVTLLHMYISMLLIEVKFIWRYFVCHFYSFLGWKCGDSCVAIHNKTVAFERHFNLNICYFSIVWELLFELGIVRSFVFAMAHLLIESYKCFHFRYRNPLTRKKMII